MRLISAADLARVQATVETLGMPDAFTLQRDTLVSDNAGGYTTTPTTAATGTCLLRKLNVQSQEQPIADRLGWVASYAVDLPLAAQPVPSDRLVINGRTFEIGAIERGGTYEVAQVAICREIG